MLHSVGVTVHKTSVIGDDITEISNEVKEFSNRFDLVLTTGGIGPTHDDVTLEAVAKAFNEKVIAHPQLVELCKKYAILSVHRQAYLFKFSIIITGNIMYYSIAMIFLMQSSLHQ